MSDGTAINPSTLPGGDVIDTESIGARGKIQRVKLALGALDVDGGDVTPTNPVPVTGSVSCSGTIDVTDRAARLLGHVTVDAAPAVTGTVAVSNLPSTQAVSAAALPLPAGAAQEHTTAASPHSVRISTGAAFVDPTQTRALTAADVVTANVGTTGGLALDATLTGGNAKAQVTNFPATQAISAASLPLPAGAATDATATKVLRGATDARKLLDYDVRTDSNPVYVGINTQAALVGDTTWTVLKLYYDASNRLVDAQAAQAIAWTARTTYAWRSSGGN